MERNFRYLAVILTIAITVGSLISMEAFPKSSIKIFDKLVHLSAYCVLTLSWLFSFKLILKKRNHFFIILVAVFIYGIVIEVLQAVLTSYRQADYYDIVANLLGITMAGILFYTVFYKKQLK